MKEELPFRAFAVLRIPLPGGITLDGVSLRVQLDYRAAKRSPQGIAFFSRERCISPVKGEGFRYSDPRCAAFRPALLSVTAEQSLTLFVLRQEKSLCDS